MSQRVLNIRRKRGMTVRVLLARFGRSRMRITVIDFGDMMIFADEFGNVGRVVRDRAEVPSKWEESAYDSFAWLYSPREETKELSMGTHRKNVARRWTGAAQETCAEGARHIPRLCRRSARSTSGLTPFFMTFSKNGVNRYDSVS
jgi:hypothetical protein